MTSEAKRQAAPKRKRMSDFDEDMLRIMRYHRKLVKLCRVYVAIQADGELFDKIAPSRYRGIKDNQKLRWLIGDDMLDLLFANGDWLAGRTR